MSIKGTTKELFVGKSEVNIITFMGNKITIPYDSIKEIEYCLARGFSSGKLTFVKQTNEKVIFEFSSKVNDSILRAIDFISEHVATMVIKQLHNLAEIINTTTDQETFEYALKEIKDKLTYLIKFEHTGIFTSLPSKDLETINNKESQTRKDFEDRCKSKNKPDFSYMKEIISKINDIDPYFFEAGKFIIEKDRGSIGMTQRLLKIGFNRAARIMDQLAEAGVVGEEEGVNSRKVLMTIEEFEYLKENYKGEFKNSSDSIVSSEEQAQIPIPEKIFMYNNKYDYMEGHDFELYCAHLLRVNGFQNVSVTQASCDQGIDIIALKDGVKYGVQCKCYSSDIGNKAVQEAFSGAKFYDCHVPVVLTNQFFTSAAQELATKINVLLWDRNYLDKLISNQNT